MVVVYQYKNMAHAFCILNNLKKGHALLPLIISYSLEYDIRKIKETAASMLEPYAEY